MSRRMDDLILQMENYVECWKQFNHYLGMARTKKFEPQDEVQFLEIKSVMTQELELILSVIETTNPSKDDILTLISSTPSIRYMSETNEASIRGLETQWHKIYIALQSLLGQMKVQQRQGTKRGFFGSLFGKN
jgi:hypothetical protein